VVSQFRYANGGAISVSRASQSVGESTLQMTNCTIEACSASVAATSASSARGNAIYAAWGASCNLQNVTFRDCIGELTDGTLYVEGSTTEVIWDNSVMVGCRARNGRTCYLASAATVVISNLNAKDTEAAAGTMIHMIDGAGTAVPNSIQATSVYLHAIRACTSGTPSTVLRVPSNAGAVPLRGIHINVTGCDPSAPLVDAGGSSIRVPACSDVTYSDLSR
jgi:hypothetical protein